jgi:fucose permease
MSLFINQADGWRAGYRVIGGIQLAIAIVVLFSLPLWKKAVPHEFEKEKTDKKPVPYKSLIAVPGVKMALLAFLIYCGMEYLCGVWGATFFVGAKGFAADTAARLVSSFYLGITAGRLASGFLTIKVSDKSLIFGGGVLVAAGIALLIMPVHSLNMAAFPLMGLGSAPLYPCLMHSTPRFFGEERAPGVIGMQMSAAGMGGMLIPPLFGLLVEFLPTSIFPLFVLLLFLVLTGCVFRLYHKTAA